MKLPICDLIYLNGGELQKECIVDLVEKIYQQGRKDTLEEIEERISKITWYSIRKGKLVEGANSFIDDPLYKNSDIEELLEQIKEDKK